MKATIKPDSILFTGWRDIKAHDKFYFFGPRATHVQVYIKDGKQTKLYIGFHNTLEPDPDYWLIRFAGKTHKVTNLPEVYYEASLKTKALNLVKLETKLALEAEKKIQKFIES